MSVASRPRSSRKGNQTPSGTCWIRRRSSSWTLLWLSSSFSLVPNNLTMPPQPGVFALPYTPAHKGRVQNGTSESADVNNPIYTNMSAGPSRVHGEYNGGAFFLTGRKHYNSPGTPVEDPKSRKRKEAAGRMGKEMSDRREEYVLSVPPSARWR